MTGIDDVPDRASAPARAGSDRPSGSGAGATLPESRALVHELLVSLAFRFRHATDGAPEGFGAFEAGSGVRTPADIVRHMTGLLRWVHEQLDPQVSRVLDPPAGFDEECERFLATLRSLDVALVAGATEQGDLPFDRLWRGPLLDAATHVGQLATLRRLAGAPIDRVRYWKVDMPDP